MIDKILVLTSEHQYYRRSGLLATLRVAGAPIDKLEFLFSYHANDYSDAVLLEKLRGLGYNYNWNPITETIAKSCILSQVLMERIALQQIVETQERTLFMHDDFYFNIKYAQFISELEQLASVSDDAIDIISFINHTRDVKRDKEKFREKTPPMIRCVAGAEMFVYGCPYDNGGVWFISPAGAQQLLDEMIDVPNLIDDVISFIIYEERGIYALRAEEKYNFFLNVREFEAESIGYYMQDPARQEKLLAPLKKYKLLTPEQEKC